MIKHLPGYEEVELWSSLAQKSHCLLQENSCLLTADCFRDEPLGQHGSNCSIYGSCWLIAEEKSTEIIFSHLTPSSADTLGSIQPW